VDNKKSGILSNPKKTASGIAASSGNAILRKARPDKRSMGDRWSPVVNGGNCSRNPNNST